MEETRNRRADFWSGLALAALGAYIVATASQWEYLGPEGPGAGFFPLWYGIAIIALSLALVMGSILRAPAGARSDWRSMGRPLALWLALVVAIAACPLLGLILSFAALTFFIVAVMYGRPLVIAATVALASAALFHLLFGVALGVALPVGPFGF